MAGPYQSVHDRHGDIDLGLYCRASLMEFLDPDEMFAELETRGVKFDVQVTGPGSDGLRYSDVVGPFETLSVIVLGGIVVNNSILLVDRVNQLRRVDRMPLMWKEASLQMEWCVDCHRDPSARLRPREAVFQMDYEPPADQIALGRRLVGLAIGVAAAMAAVGLLRGEAIALAVRFFVAVLVVAVGIFQNQEDRIGNQQRDNRFFLVEEAQQAIFNDKPQDQTGNNRGQDQHQIAAIRALIGGEPLRHHGDGGIGANGIEAAVGHVQDLHHTIDQRESDRDQKQPGGVHDAIY